VLGPGESATVNLALSPAGPGDIEGSVGLRVTNGSIDVYQGAFFEAQAEPVDLAVTPAELDFGDVMQGDSADRTVTVRNDSTVSPGHVLSFTAPNGDFSVVGSSLPVTIPPGDTAILTFRYAPSGPGAPTGNLQLNTDDPDSPHVIQLEVYTGGQEVIELGTRTFAADGNTSTMNFDVPADAIGFMIEGVTGASTEVGLRLLTGPNGEVFENETLTGPYLWYPFQYGIFTAMVPNTDQSIVQIPPGGGTWALRLYRRSGSAPNVDVRVIVERRPAPGTQNIATLDLNVFLANAITPTAATAATDVPLQAVITVMGQILGQQGISIGDIDYYDVTDPTYDDVTTSEFGPMLELSAAATEVRLNLFFVRTALGNGVLGVSPSIGGPQLNGTEYSGVMSLYTTTDTSLVGLVAAHEIGHFVGLAHTRESDGSYDNIDDTANCPSSHPDCSQPGGGYLMHWTAGGTKLTNGQGLVIRGHPHMSPAEATGNPLMGKLRPVPAFIAVPDAFKSKNWCATCQASHKSR
jgi:hypothetical protein